MTIYIFVSMFLGNLFPGMWAFVRVQIGLYFLIYLAVPRAELESMATVVFLVGTENATIAFLCAMFDIVPFGPMIGGVIMIFLTIASTPELDFSMVILPRTGYVILGIVIGQLIDNFFPRPLSFQAA